MKTKPVKMTHQIYLTIKKFGKDLGGHILSFLFQCDECKDMTTGPKYTCDSCSFGMELCRQCYDLKGFHCCYLPCLRCNICQMYHCCNHNPHLAP